MTFPTPGNETLNVTANYLGDPGSYETSSGHLSIPGGGRHIHDDQPDLDGAEHRRDAVGDLLGLITAGTTPLTGGTVDILVGTAAVPDIAHCPSAPLTGGVFTCSAEFDTPGTYNVTVAASYSGVTGTYWASSGAQAFQVEVGPAPTTTTTTAPTTDTTTATTATTSETTDTTDTTGTTTGTTGTTTTTTTTTA